MLRLVLSLFRISILLVWLLIGLLWLIVSQSGKYSSLHKVSIKIFARGVLAISGVKLSVRGMISDLDKPVILVSNHISWLDIFLIHATCAGFFVAKSEIKAWPLIGILVKKAGTIFIDRASRKSLQAAIVEIKEVLQKSGIVVFFPEGTTSDGRKILPFHSGLFSIFIRNKKCQIVPVVIRYTQYSRFCKAPAFIGNMTFLTSVLSILRARDLEAEVFFLEKVTSQEAIEFPDSLSRKIVANKVRNAMQEHLQSTNC
ncbi:MAG: hypothetical protein CBC42_04030 [Betaproteobacteria bacterium TMED82]|nr:MAG: hypothetical protein CBC42_04030 [Betaproteobacteria bacterium TMED82]